MSADKTIIFSIKPKYTSLMFSGCKTVELRRTQPRQVAIGSRVLIWETSPSKHLAGTARVESIVRHSVQKLWRAISKYAAVSRKEFDDYFDGVDNGVAVFLTDIVEFRSKPKLTTLRHEIDFRPPQSFRYVSHSEKKYFECY